MAKSMTRCGGLNTRAALLENMRQFWLGLIENTAGVLRSFSKNVLAFSENNLRTPLRTHVM
jgi:hypothetical protein